MFPILSLSFFQCARKGVCEECCPPSLNANVILSISLLLKGKGNAEQTVDANAAEIAYSTLQMFGSGESELPN